MKINIAGSVSIKHVKKEAESSGAYVWITSGYTIENYIPTGVLHECISEVYPNHSYTISEDRFWSPLGSKFRGKSIYPDKIRIAKSLQTKKYQIKSERKKAVRRPVGDIRKAND